VGEGERAIIHVDMDAFYASVEQRDRPELKGRPVIVGGHPTRGVVLAASYEVRHAGVRSAMPMAQALRRAPDAVVVPPRFEAYVEASEEVFAIFESVTPLVEPLSLDEAFLDVTASRQLFGAPAAIATRIRAEIAHKLRLPASAGIAAVKFVAKIASDFAKPNGQHEVPADETRAFLAPLAVARLWGVGPKMDEALRRLGLRTVGDIAAADPDRLESRLPGSRGLWELAHGIDGREVISDRAAKSIGAEDTFDEDLERGELGAHVHAQALRVGRRLRRAGVKARTVQLKIKLADFRLITRRTTLDDATDDGQALYRAAQELLAKVPLPIRVRLTGVSAQEIVAAGPQQELFAPPPGRAQHLNQALDKIAARFGSAAVVTADVNDIEERARPRRE
jgi:DNA polymerase IV